MSNRFSVFNSDPDEKSIDDVYSDIIKKNTYDTNSVEELYRAREIAKK